MHEILPSIYQWSWFSPEKGYNFNGHLVAAGNETVVIDPPPLSSRDQETLVQQGPIAAIILTNRDHVREADALRKLLRTKVLAPEPDAPLMETRPDGTFGDQDALPGGMQAIHIPDNKSPGESALLLRRGKGVLILGDALVGKPGDRLQLMPPEKYADAVKAREGIRVLLGYEFDSILVGDGVSILTGGKAAIRRFLGRAEGEQ